MDSNTGLHVFDTLKKLSRDKLVIVVTHDRDFAELYGDRVIEFKDGVVISDIEKYSAQLTRACVELAKDWRTDRYLRKLEAMMIVADKDVTLVLTGNGDVLEPQHGLIGIGSGGSYAQAAALALIDTDLSAEEIVTKSMNIAADICIYTNHNIITEKL